MPNPNPSHIPNSPTGNNRRSPSVSMRDGIRCFFDLDDITIEVWASAWTGMEEVRVDGDPVSRKRSLRFSTEHCFEHAGIDYRVVVETRSLLSATLGMRLYRNGTLVDSDYASAYGRDLIDADGRIKWSQASRRILPVILFSAVAGMIFGYAVGTLVKWIGG